MNTISQVYRKACREIGLPKEEKQMFMRLLREISVNAVRYHKAWQVKEDFMVLWFISVGSFPELAIDPYGGKIADWIHSHLPFELSTEERQSLWQ
jgi:hypothetical protein